MVVKWTSTTEWINLPIFFIVFRETFESSIVITVLISLVNNVAADSDEPQEPSGAQPDQDEDERSETSSLAQNSPSSRVCYLPRDHDEEREALLRHRGSGPTLDPTPNSNEVDSQDIQKIVKRLRFQVLLGACLGFLISLFIGAVLILVYFESLAERWAAAEEIWELIFSAIAAFLIFFMALGVLRMEHAKEKWRVKLRKAFDRQQLDVTTNQSGKVFFLLPFVTVLREGLEAVIFVAGIALGSDPTSIGTSVFLGILCGLIVGLAIWYWGNHGSLRWFLIISTNLLLLLGAGLASNAVAAYERYVFNQLVGGDAAESGNGPGSYPVDGNIFHFDCCNPEDKVNGGPWMLFGSFGWSNNGSIYTVFTYIAYWLAVVVVILKMMIKKGKLVPLLQWMGARPREQVG